MKHSASKTVFIAIFAVLLAASSAFAAPVQRIRQIKSPLLSVPVFVKPGEVFKIATDAGNAGAAVSASIAGAPDAGRKAELKLGSISINGSLGAGTYGASVPSGTPEGLYDLTVKFADGTTDTQPHSVAVVREFKSDFDFVHITDIHFNLSRVSNEQRAELLHDINKLDPAFVVFSGDVGLNPGTHDADYRTSYEYLQRELFEPVFMVPGNHELYADTRMETGQPTGRQYWAMTYGPEYNSFDYGPLHVVGVNDFDWPDELLDRWNPEVEKLGLSDHACINEAQWEWLKTDLAAASAAGKTSVLYTHVPVELLMGGQRAGKKKIPGPSMQVFLRLLKNNSATHVFVGHLHMDSVRPLNNAVTEVLTVGAGTFMPGAKVKETGYRIVHVRGGKVTGWDTRQFTVAGGK